MKLVFMGSGEFAVPSLERLLDDGRHDVAALVTQPDRPAGRGHRLRPPPTKKLAVSRGIPVHQPPKVRAPEAVELLRETAPDCVVVVAYGQIIPESILAIPPRGIVNVHASLLPALRGAAPIQWAIARGLETTGVTTMLMDAGLDTGPILLKREEPVAPDDTSATLSPRLAALGADLLAETLASWEQGALAPEPQDDAAATKAPLLRKEDARVDWSFAAREIERRVRAFDPWPVVFTRAGETTVKIWRASVGGPAGERAPGTIVRVSTEASDGVDVACGDGACLSLEEVQPEGGARMDGASFARGRRLAPGDRFESAPAGSVRR